MKSLLFLVLLFVWFNTFSQQVLNGFVIDERTGEALTGAIILIKQTTTGVNAQSDGSFTLPAPQTLPFTIEVSYSGYASREIEIYEIDQALSVELKNNSVLDEVVVIGYGEQEREDVVGSVVKVNPAGVHNIPTGSFDAQIQGKAAGVQISTNSGVPGADVFIRVRGATSINASNDPLYVIDGVFVNNSSLQNIAQDRATSPMSDINPADIESVEILKDASAVAIYGSRGANGVVIVTTKRGKFANKTRINFSVSEGLAWAPKDRIWKAVTGLQHATLLNEYNANIGQPQPFRPANQVINGVAGRGLPEEQPTYDRLSYLFRTAQVRDYNLSVQGGTENTRFYIGGGYNFQEAIWRPMDFNRIGLKFNLDHKLNNRISFGTSNVLSRSYRNQGRPANGGNGTLLQASLSIPTYLPIFDANGIPLRWVNFDNIYTLTSRVNLWSTSYRYIGNIYGEAEILPALKFRTSFSVDLNNYEENQYWQKATILGSAGGLGTQSVTLATQLINEQLLTYSKNIGRHHIGALVGNTLQGVTLNNVTANGQNFPNDSYTQISTAATQTASQFKTGSTLVSFFSRVDYNYYKRYYLELSGRADASSRFGINNKWGYFPAVGLAWRISEENFLKESILISNLKLRTSYGITGNQAGINDFASLGLWNGGYGYADIAQNAENPGTAPFQISNPDLRWEKTSQLSSGLDLGFFNNRINLEFNIYSKYTTDLLIQIPIPSSTGFTFYTVNYGEISNRGFELGISTINFQSKSFTWRTELNASQNRNVVEKIPIPIQGYDGRNLLSIQQGNSLYSYWVYNQTGVNRETGNIEIEDVNKDGRITAADRKIMGSTWPKLFGGFTNNFSFKAFDLGVFFTYSYGNRIWNHNEVLGEQGGTLGDNRVLMVGQLDRWTTPGQVTMVPKLTTANYSYFELSRFLEDASFVRLRSLTLGYTLPQSLSRAIKLEKLRLSFTATNLWLATKYSGADPESNLGQGNLQGYDYDTPPQPRTVQLGLNITL